MILKALLIILLIGIAIAVGVTFAFLYLVLWQAIFVTVIAAVLFGCIVYDIVSELLNSDE